MFKCDASVLMSAIEEVAGFYAAMGAKGNLSRVQISSPESGKLLLVAYTKPGTMQVVVPGEGSIDGLTDAESRDLASVKRLVGKKTGTEVRLEAKPRGQGRVLHFESSGKSASVDARNLQEKDRTRTYPRLPKQTQVDPTMLRDLLVSTLDSVSTDETRSHLNSIFLQAQKGKWIAVATDGHRLGMAQAKGTAPVAFTKLVRLPIATALRKWTEARSTASIIFSVKDMPQEKYQTDTCELMIERRDKTGLTSSVFVPVSDSGFPAYSHVIPSLDSMITGVELRTQRVRSCLEVYRALLTGRRVDGVTLGILDGRVGVGYAAHVNDDGLERIFAELDGEVIRGMPEQDQERSVAVSVGYLLEGLTHFTDEKFSLYFSHELDPLLLVGTHGVATVTNVVMPMRDGEGSGLRKHSAAQHPQMTLASKSLAAEASFVAACAEPKATMPALSQIHITLGPTTLAMRATDLYLTASSRMPVPLSRVDLPIAVLVHGRLLDRVARSMSAPDLNVGLSVVTEGAKIPALRVFNSHLRMFVDLRGLLPADDFPPFPDPLQATHLMGVPAPAFKDALDAALTHINTDWTRAAQNSMLMAPNGHGLLRLVSTNGVGMTIVDLAARPEYGWSEFTDMLMPRNGVQLALKMMSAGFDQKPSQVQVSKIGPNVALKIERVTGERAVTAKLVDAQYPQYRSAFPSGEPWASGYLDHSSFKSALAGVLGIESKRAGRLPQLLVSMSPGTARIKGALSGASDKSTFVLDGQPFELIKIAGERLNEMLSSVTSDQVGLEYRGLDAPVLFQGTHGPYVNVRGLFMPKAVDVKQTDEQKTTVVALPPLPTPELAPVDSPEPQQAAPAPKRRRAAAPRPAAPFAAARLHIEDADLMQKLEAIEGRQWWARQMLDEWKLRDPNGVFTNRQAYLILKELGPEGSGLAISDLIPGAGFIAGEAGRGYVVMPDGEIVMLGETAGAAAKKKAASIMAVVEG